MWKWTVGCDGYIRFQKRTDDSPTRFRKGSEGKRPLLAVQIQGPESNDSGPLSCSNPAAVHNGYTAYIWLHSLRTARHMACSHKPALPHRWRKCPLRRPALRFCVHIACRWFCVGGRWDNDCPWSYADRSSHIPRCRLQTWESPVCRTYRDQTVS